MDANFAKRCEEFLELPLADPRVVPLAEELVEAVRELSASSEHLQRYREMRQRMGPVEDAGFTIPNFPYTLHTS